MAAEEAKQLITDGAQLFKEGKLEEAADKLKAAVEADPNSVLAHSYLGAVYSQMKETPLSIQQFQAAADLDPANASLQFNLAQAFENAGSKPRALDLYRKALELDPKYARAKQRLEALGGVGVAKPAPAPRPTAPAPAQPAEAPGIGSAAAPVAQAPSPYAPPAQSAGGGYSAPPPMVKSGAAAALESRVARSANWFYWIAGMSLINTVVTLLHIGWRFSIGLGFTSFLDAIKRRTQRPPDRHG